LGQIFASVPCNHHAPFSHEQRLTRAQTLNTSSIVHALKDNGDRARVRDVLKKNVHQLPVSGGRMKNMRGVAALLAAATHEKTEFVVARAGQPQLEH
jgi:hypothetical protein